MVEIEIEEQGWFWGFLEGVADHGSVPAVAALCAVSQYSCIKYNKDYFKRLCSTFSIHTTLYMPYRKSQMEN